MAMNNLFKTRTLASRAELGLEFIKFPFSGWRAPPDTIPANAKAPLPTSTRQGEVGFEFLSY
jgi:hypothetical protein